MGKPNVITPVDERVLTRTRSSIENHIIRIRVANLNQHYNENFRAGLAIPQKNEKMQMKDDVDSTVFQRSISSVENHIRPVNSNINSQSSTEIFKRNSESSYLVPQKTENRVEMKDDVDSRVLQRRISSVENHINRIRSVNTNTNGQSSNENFKRNSKRSSLVPQKREEMIEMKNDVDSRVFERRHSSVENHIRSVKTDTNGHSSTENFKRNSKNSLVSQKTEERGEIKDDVDSRVLQRRVSSVENHIDRIRSANTNKSGQSSTENVKRNSKRSSLVPQKREERIEMKNDVDLRIIERRNSSVENPIGSINTNINGQDSAGNLKRNSNSSIPQQREENVEMKHDVDSRILERRDNSAENRSDLNRSVNTDINEQDGSTGNLKRNSSASIPQQREEGVEIKHHVDSRILEQRDNSAENRIDLKHSVNTDTNEQNDSTGNLKRTAEHGFIDSEKGEEKVEMEANVDKNTNELNPSEGKNANELNSSENKNTNELNSSECLEKKSENSKNLITDGPEKCVEIEEASKSSTLQRRKSFVDAIVNRFHSGNKKLNKKKSPRNLKTSQAKKTKNKKRETKMCPAVMNDERSVEKVEEKQKLSTPSPKAKESSESIKDFKNSPHDFENLMNLEKALSPNDIQIIDLRIRELKNPETVTPNERSYLVQLLKTRLDLSQNNKPESTKEKEEKILEGASVKEGEESFERHTKDNRIDSKTGELTLKSNSDKYLEQNPNIELAEFIENQIQKILDVDSKDALIGEEFSKEIDTSPMIT